MDFFQVVSQRYSHKAAMDPHTPPSIEELRRIVEAGVAAPSAMNRQSPEFVIVNDAETLRRVAELTGGHAVLSTAPAIVAVLANPQAAGEGFYRQDCAAATENVLLAATSLGYAVGWIDGILANEAVRAPLSELLGVPDDRLLVTLIPVGKPAEDGPRRAKKPFGERVSWNRYGETRTN